MQLNNNMLDDNTWELTPNNGIVHEAEIPAHSSDCRL